jgi:phytoene dehydrogenase-like protein
MPRSTGWIQTSAGLPDIYAGGWVGSSDATGDLDEGSGLTGSKVTVFPVPVSRKAEAEEADPARLQAELERLRAENVVLRTRLAAVEAIALEREGTIDDLRHALQMLPSAWAEQLEEQSDSVGEEADPPLPPPRPPSTPERVDTDDAEALFAEVAALRVRLERKRLEAEQDILRQERERLRQERERAHGWRRSRGASPTSG